MTVTAQEQAGVYGVGLVMVAKLSDFKARAAKRVREVCRVGLKVQEAFAKMATTGRLLLTPHSQI